MRTYNDRWPSAALVSAYFSRCQTQGLEELIENTISKIGFHSCEYREDPSHIAR